MCFFDQVVYTCGDWKWDRFRGHCNHEYRIGETCGIKLVNDSIYHSDLCKLCQKIETKERRKLAEASKIERWQAGGGKLKASIQKSWEIVRDLDAEILMLNSERDRKNQALGKVR